GVIILVQMEMPAYPSHQLGQIGMAEEGRGAAPQVQSLHRLITFQMPGDQLHLAVKRSQIGLCTTAVLGDNPGTPAVMTGAGAERDMDVQEQWSIQTTTFPQRGDQVIWEDAVTVLGSRRVGSVKRSGLVVAADQTRVPTDWIGHGKRAP